MALKWTPEQLRAMRDETVPDELMKDMLETNRADAWMLQLALERSAENDDLDPGEDRERRGHHNK